MESNISLLEVELCYYWVTIYSRASLVLHKAWDRLYYIVWRDTSTFLEKACNYTVHT